MIHLERSLEKVHLLKCTPISAFRKAAVTEREHDIKVSRPSYVDTGQPPVKFTKAVGVARIHLFDSIQDRQARILRATDDIDADRRTWLAQAEDGGSGAPNGISVSGPYMTTHHTQIIDIHSKF